MVILKALSSCDVSCFTFPVFVETELKVVLIFFGHFSNLLVLILKFAIVDVRAILTI